MLKEFAPAKVNLFLDILKKRSDGYHDLGTLFQTIDVGDMLFGEANGSGEITVHYDEPQPYPLESDLVYKAAKLLQATFEVKLGADFHLEKKLPLGAGLGGGSSDAAAALRLLNKIWNLNLSAGELEKLGAKLGADVPFLIRGGSALAEGIGDILTKIPSLKIPDGARILVATPHSAVPTKDAYAGCIPSGPERWESYKNSKSQDLGAFAFNKFEESVFPKYPLIAQMKQDFLDCGAKFSLMSGSGASVFGLFDSESLVEAAAKKLGPSARFLAVTRLFEGFSL